MIGERVCGDQDIWGGFWDREETREWGSIEGATTTLIRREGTKSSYESLDFGCVHKYLLILLLFCGVLTNRTPSWAKTLVTSEEKWRRHESEIGGKSKIDIIHCE